MKWFFFIFFLPCYLSSICQLCRKEITTGEVKNIALEGLFAAHKRALVLPWPHIYYSDEIYNLARRTYSYSEYRDRIFFLLQCTDNAIKDTIHYYAKEIDRNDSKSLSLKDFLKDTSITSEKTAHICQQIDQYQQQNTEHRSCITTMLEDQKATEEILTNTLNRIGVECIKIYTICIENHKDKNSYFERSLAHFDLGNTENCIEDIQQIINHESVAEGIAQEPSEIYFLQGLNFSDLCQYKQAVQSLSDAIRLNPNNKEAYLERAIAYFELGDLDLSLADFLASGKSSSSISVPSSFEFASGFLLGAIQGGQEGIVEFIPSMMNSVSGLGHALWSFATMPISFSNEMFQACELCMDYLRNHSTLEILSELIPELRELIADWDILSSNQKGWLIGSAIGKHGIEIFAPAGIFKGVKVYQELRKANAIMTLKACSFSSEARNIISQEVLKRQEIGKTFKTRANLKIHSGRQAKHILGHPHYERGKSILTHPDPQHLVSEFAGQGHKVKGTTLGVSGYVEVVDFGEVIGMYVEENTLKQIPTTRGKIHYGEKGTHIVPAPPRRK